EQLADREVGILLRIRAPGDEARRKRDVAGGERGVHEQQALEALRHFHRQRQAEQAAPVLDDQGDVLQIPALDELEQKTAVEVERIERLVVRLVGAAEADEIRRDDARARG